MYIFKTQEEIIYNPEIGTYKAFGITVYRKSTCELICEITDVFTDLQKALEFTSLCNTYQPEPVHLSEIITDYIQ